MSYGNIILLFLKIINTVNQMNFKLACKISLASMLVLVGLTVSNPAKSQTASIFQENRVEQRNFIAVARPLGQNNYDLLVIEQVPGQRSCWAENGSQPTYVDLLLGNFDFTNSCRRSTDSNGYSIRKDNMDYGLDYLLRIVQQNGELLLVGTHRTLENQPEIIVGRSNGMPTVLNPVKINLEPGWYFTRRAYQGKSLGHVYFSNNQGGGVASSFVGEYTGQTAQSSSGAGYNVYTSFQDLKGDLYQKEIEQGVSMGFIAQGKNFRPNNPITREELLSMVIEALKILPNTNINIPTEVPYTPYPDVSKQRWSATKIAWAQQTGVFEGYIEGSFNPTAPVTREELTAVLYKAAEYARLSNGLPASFPALQPPIAFSDIAGRRGQEVINMMAMYCRSASPLNEQGNSFAPGAPAKRNYAAATTVRMVQCVMNEIDQAKK